TYLNKNATILHGRFVAKQRPATWYRTIDKVNHDLTRQPKLLLQDMKTTIHPVLERGGYYPHHNLYFVVSKAWDMEVLGGLLLSDVAQAFMAAYCVRMRGGTLRFQAQYLKQFRVPAPDAIAAPVADDLREAFRRRDRHAATRAAVAAYSSTATAGSDVGDSDPGVRLVPPVDRDQVGGQPLDLPGVAQAAGVDATHAGDPTGQRLHHAHRLPVVTEDHDVEVAHGYLGIGQQRGADVMERRADPGGRQ